MRDKLIRELHSGGLGGHFGIDNTKGLVKENYYWQVLVMNVRKWIHRCRICQHGKGRSHNIGIYIPSHVREVPWEDIKMDFVLGLP